LRFTAETSFGGGDMETNEKTFRYSQIKSLVVLYMMFLVLCMVAGLFVGIREFMFFAVLIGIGVILLVLFLTSSVTISDSTITTKNLFGKKTIQWSEIRHVSSKGASIRLHNQEGRNTVSISPGLDKSVEIFDLLYSKRPDLFSIKKNNPFVYAFRSTFIYLAIGLLLTFLSLLLYFNRSYFSILMILIGLGNLGAALFTWYFSPRRITLENDCLIVNYINNKSRSISADDIDAIQPGRTKQNQFKSVDVFFQNRRSVLPLSGFKQSPYIIYSVLLKWHQIYAKKQPVLPS
jgi:hypothetical protein